MKILYLSLRFPYPPISGDKIRTYNILKHLSIKHSISFISFSLSPDEKKDIDKMMEFCDEVSTVDFSKTRGYANCILNSYSSEPFQISYWYSPEMQKKVDNLMEKDGFDLIHVQFFRMAQYVKKYTYKRKILDSGDSFWLNLSRRSKLDRGIAWPLLKLEASKVKIYETEIAKWFDQVTMVSPLDMQCLLSNNSILPVSVVPMGVDLEYYQPGKRTDELNLLFTGTISYFPNRDAVLYFYHEIFPLIKQSFPKAKLYVVGTRPPKSITSLMGNNDIVVTGRVEDVRPYFDKSTVFVCPLRSGSGMQAKLLEAMAMGVPIVTTSMGVTALDAVLEKDLMIADDPKLFAQKVVQLLKDRELRQNMALSARNLVEQKYDWTSIVGQFDEVYKKAMTVRS